MVRENCGVVGVFSLDNKNVIPILIDSLRALQHRAAGVTADQPGHVRRVSDRGRRARFGLQAGAGGRSRAPRRGMIGG